MQNKSPLQVKSVPSVCSRLPSSPGNQARDLVPISLALDLISSLMCLHKSIPLLPSLLSCLIGPHLACSPHSPSTVLSLGSPNVLHKSSENQLCLLLMCLLCSSAASLFAALWKAFMLFLSVFLHLSQLASDMCSLPFLLLSIHMFSIEHFCASVSVSIKWR